MTKNQIEYWRNVETNRNNLITEAETKRSNQVREMEQERHNREQERLTESQILESQRHSMEQERLALLSHYEVQRSNQQQEALSAHRNLISSASNDIQRQSVVEQITHNRNQESTNLLDAATRQSAQIEQSRSNKENEYQNLIRMGDQRVLKGVELRQQERHNKASEGIQKQSNAFNLLSSLASTVGRLLAGRKTK